MANEIQQFNKNCPKLNDRIESVQSNNSNNFSNESNVELQTQSSQKDSALIQSDPLDWNESQVEKWLSEKGVSAVYEILKPLDGKVLYQLYLVQMHTPEFFYKSLTKNEIIDIKVIAYFTLALKELFE